VVLAASGAHSCVIATDGRVWCWGTRSHILVCEPNCVVEPPHAVDGLEDVVEVALGLAHGCALKSDATVVCWGENDIGQVGPYGDGINLAPQGVPLEKEVRHIGAGTQFSCAVATDGSTTCWGATPTLSARGGGNTDPELVEYLGPVAFLSGAYEHACALLESGEIECWGTSRWGKLGTGTPTSPMSFAPIHVAGLAGVTLLDSAPNRNCVLFGVGDLTCWGRNVGGLPVGGNDVEQPDPAPFPVGAPLTRVTLGNYHACGLREDGHVLCWGMNSSGQLGAGDVLEHEGAVEVEGLSDVVEIRAGSDHTCALTRANEIWCWGMNSDRQLGFEGSTVSEVPVQVDVSL
jgi:alpha-tubulin suppressor-like RCC1 family protein